MGGVLFLSFSLYIKNSPLSTWGYFGFEALIR
nr:MAG TPA: hypothetical protein [Caudoviricetes sp.]